MKLSKIILENKEVIEKTQLEFTSSDIDKLTEAITSKLEEYLDTGNQELIRKSVASAINEIVSKD
jgi:hypothetical protein|tara:strand:- start:55 stop:249 length:195 start_codon:yes stop_codon:yes gene_type:complete